MTQKSGDSESSRPDQQEHVEEVMLQVLDVLLRQQLAAAFGLSTADPGVESSEPSSEWRRVERALDDLDAKLNDHQSLIAHMLAKENLFSPEQPEAMRPLFDSLDSLRATAEHKDKAVAALPSSVREAIPTAIAERNRWLDACVEHAGGQAATFFGTLSGMALGVDASGKKADRVLLDLLELRPSQRLRHGNEHDYACRRIGLFQTSRCVLANPEAFVGYGHQHYRAMVHEEARRDGVSQLMRSRDRLGLTPQLVHMRSKTPEEKAMRRERYSLNDAATEALLIEHLLGDAEILLMADRDVDACIEEIVSAVEAPDDQAALMRVRPHCDSWAESRRLTGAGQSVENALRSRLERHAEQLAEVRQAI